jgi:hypothetical protein
MNTRYNNRYKNSQRLQEDIVAPVEPVKNDNCLQKSKWKGQDF